MPPASLAAPKGTIARVLGRVRALQVPRTGSCTSLPLHAPAVVKSIGGIEFRTVSPASAMQSTMEVAMNWASNTQRPGTMVNAEHAPGQGLDDEHQPASRR